MEPDPSAPPAPPASPASPASPAPPAPHAPQGATPSAVHSSAPTAAAAAATRGHWLDDPAHVKLLWRGFLAMLALMVLLEAVVHLHPHFGIEGLFGFNAWFGFLACAAMIVVAKGLALVLKRTDTYYERLARRAEGNDADD